MKKIGNIITAVILGLGWIYVFYRFPHTGVIAKILGLLILVPFTVKVVYGFLLERSQKKNASDGDKLAENFTPFSASDTSADTSGDCFCTECGTKNQQGTKFCVNCGKPLQKND